MVNLKINGEDLIPFTINAKPVMEHYLNLVESELSDYTFCSNFIWLSHASAFYSITKDTFCLFMLNGNELSMLLPPLGKKENINDAINTCFEIMGTNNTYPVSSRIEYVAESILIQWVDYLEEGTTIFEVLGDYIVEKKLVDYVYVADDLIHLRGNSYHSKRNEINKFKKAHPTYRIDVFDPILHADETMLLFDTWVSNKIRYIPKGEVPSFLDGIGYERDAFKRAIRYYKELNLLGITLWIDDKLAGMTFGEKICDNSASILLEKTDFNYLGSAQFIFREYCKVLLDTYNIEYINAGDDMGFENLKKVKMSYRPSILIPKYVIYKKQL